MDKEDRIDKFKYKLWETPTDYEYLKEELANGFDINEVDPPALFYADDYEFALFLLENGADPNKYQGWRKVSDDDNNSSGFHSLIGKKYKKKEDHYKIIKLAIEKGADINYKDVAGRTALDLAIRTGDKKLIELLKSYGAEIGNPDFTKGVFIGKLKPNPFDEEIYSEDRVEVIQEFINNGYDLNTTYMDKSLFNNKTILNYAVYFQSFHRYNKSCKTTELLLKSGANPNAYVTSKSSGVSENNPPLHNALQSIYDNFYAYGIPYEGELAEGMLTSQPTEVIELLIKYGADVNLINHDGFTPLDMALEMEHFWAEEILSKHGAKYNTYLGEENVVYLEIYKLRKLDYLLRLRMQEYFYKSTMRSEFSSAYFGKTSIDNVKLPEIHKKIMYFYFRCAYVPNGKPEYTKDKVERDILEIKNLNERDDNGFTILDYRPFIRCVDPDLRAEIKEVFIFLRKLGAKHSLELDYPKEFEHFYNSDYKDDAN